MKKKEVNIFGYTDFRQLIHDRLSEMKKADRRFTRSYICEKIGLRSNSYLKRIIDGDRKLTKPLASKLAREMGFDKFEQAFFLDLVDFGQAADTAERRDALKRLKRRRGFKRVHRMELDHFDYMSNPLLLALREMVALADFKEDAKWIASRLRIPASRKEIVEGLALLEKLGLVRRDKNGKLELANTHQKTENQFGSVSLRSYHRNMLKLGLSAMELPVETRNYTGLTMAMTTAQYNAVVKEYRSFLDRVRLILDSESDYDHVYHMEAVLFPLTEVEEEGAPARKNVGGRRKA